MLEFAIPGRARLAVDFLVLDYNGTLACDGELLPGAEEKLRELALRVDIHIITGDTFGKARDTLAHLPCELVVVPPDEQASAKLRYIQQLGSSRCVCIGNGRNDRLILKAAALGIAVVQSEGAAVETLLAADVVALDIGSAFSLLLQPLRLAATLRS